MVEVAFFDSIDQNLDFDSARQVPPCDEIFSCQKMSYIDRYYYEFEKNDFYMPNSHNRRLKKFQVWFY